MEKLLEHLGYTTPFVYMAAAYGLFAWLDENASDAAKAALAKTIKLKEVRSAQVAAAFLEMFDRLYTEPLLTWRAFSRSAFFTLLVTIIFLYEHIGYSRIRDWLVSGPTSASDHSLTYNAIVIGTIFATNVLTDYLSLFPIRSWLIRGATRPVSTLVISAFIGVVVVGIGAILRFIFTVYAMYDLDVSTFLSVKPDTIHHLWFVSLRSAIPAMMVFSWLLLFALGVVIIRLLVSLSWVTSKAQWALIDGEKHALRAVGCVAGLIVFVMTVAWQAIET